jgi:hypothetical protein
VRLTDAFSKVGAGAGERFEAGGKPTAIAREPRREFK